MKIVAAFSFNNGQETVEKQFPNELDEIKAAIMSVDAAIAHVKQSREITMAGRMLYSPKALNKALLDDQLYQRGWSKPKVLYTTSVSETGEQYSGFIEGDGVKNGLGLEVQFGKYAFLGLDILGKMPIYARHGIFTAGVEVVPMASFRRGQMSTGIGCFEQIKGILEQRGVSNLDIPVAVLGTAPDVGGIEEPELAEEDLPPDMQ